MASLICWWFKEVEWISTIQCYSPSISYQHTEDDPVKMNKDISLLFTLRITWTKIKFSLQNPTFFLSWTTLLEFIIFIIFVYVLVFVSMQYTWICILSGTRRNRITWNWSYRWLWPPDMVLESKVLSSFSHVPFSPGPTLGIPSEEI